jgi:hypothetical protein
MNRAQLGLFAGDRRRSGRTRAGWDVTVRALRDTGRLEPIDEAIIKLGRVVADELDDACHDLDESRFTRNALAKTMLQVIAQLRDQTRPDVDALSIEDLFASLGDTADAIPSE